MNKKLTICLLTAPLLGLALSAQAQVTFSVGPKAGLNTTSSHFAPDERFASQGVTITSATSYRSGLEVGIIGAIGFGHFLVQPAVLYSQKGFGVEGTQSNVQGIDGTIPAPY